MKRDTIITIINGIVAAANIGVLIFLGQQISINRQSLNAAERAWLTGIPEKIYISNDTPKNFAVVMRLRNAGKGPAFEVRHEVNLIPMPTPPTAPVLSTPGAEPSELTIGGGITTDPLIPYPKSWGTNDKAVEAIERGDIPLYVWLRIHYRDPVEDGRYTQECWKYNREFKRLVFCGPGTQIHR